MKFLAPLFFTSVLAVSLDLRDPKIISRQAVNDIQRDFAAITSAVQALGTQLRSFNGPDQALAVNGASAAVTDALKKAVSDANAIAPLTQEDALSLGGPTGDLNTAVVATLDELVAKRSVFVNNGFGETVYNTLLEQQKLSQDFSDALVSKLPQGIQDIARGLSKPSSDANAKAVEAFRNSGTGTSSATTPANTPVAPATTPADTPAETPAYTPQTTMPTTTKAAGGYNTPVSNISDISNISNISPSTSGSSIPTYTSAGGGSGASTTSPGPAAYTGGAVSNAASFGAIAAVAVGIVAVL